MNNRIPPVQYMPAPQPSNQQYYIDGDYDYAPTPRSSSRKGVNTALTIIGSTLAGAAVTFFVVVSILASIISSFMSALGGLFVF